jgi:hypothetical protein
MHIRAYRDSDLPLLCQIFLRAVRETASRDYTPAQIAAWAQVDETRWRQKLADSIGLVAVVSINRLALSPPSGRISICSLSRRITPGRVSAARLSRRSALSILRKS